MSSPSQIQDTHVPSYHELRARYVGRRLQEIPTPAAVVDYVKVKHNCDLMLNTVKELDVRFRAHVKTHKTSEVTRLQVGEDCKDVRVIVSTVREAEQLLPLLQDYGKSGAKVNVLYGVLPSPSQVERLATIGRALGERSIAVMIDHPAQLPFGAIFKAAAGFRAEIFVKVDSGTRRAGLSPESQSMAQLLTEVAELDSAGKLIFRGFYSHAGHSYEGNNPADAMTMLRHEIEVCHDTAKRAPPEVFAGRTLTVSVGASPTALSAQNLRRADHQDDSAAALRQLLKAEARKFEIELHAGVYPFLDMQQIAARSRELDGDHHDHIAFTILAEICSLYPEREKPEALMAAGCLALAREPCKDYKGWGVVSPWGILDGRLKAGQGHCGNTRLIVERISQEHGIIAFENDISRTPIPLTFGQKVRIWPNHACIASAMYDWYIVVDSSSRDPDKVGDIWLRWRGR